MRSIVLRVILFTSLAAAAPAYGVLTQRCNWGASPPAFFPGSVQVIATPVVLNFGAPGGLAQIAFISFQTNTQANQDSGGVLRIINPQCVEIARFPNPGNPACAFTPLLNMPPGFGVIPDLAPLSGIAAGNIDNTGTAEIIAVIGGGSPNHKQIAAFNLVGNCIMPKWVSSATALPAADVIPTSAPAIAQLDVSPISSSSEIIIDNKVFNANGTLRYTGFNGGGNNCGANAPCPRSRATIVANVLGLQLPQVITGRGIYASTTPNTWTGPSPALPTIVPQISNLAAPLVYPAVAELDPNSFGPEIVATDTMTSTLFVLRNNGTLLASTAIPSPGLPNPQCGGPPMIGDAAGLPGPEIGVASCNRYTLFRYNAGTIASVWSMPTADAGGQTTSTLFNSPTGPRIVYADQVQIRVFNATTGAVLQTLPQSSATAIEGPVIASFDTGPLATPTCLMSRGSVIVVSNNIWGGAQKGVRIFDDPDIGNVASCWNEHSFHITNLSNSAGTIPAVEAPSWTGLPARNTFRVQRWP